MTTSPTVSYPWAITNVEGLVQHHFLARTQLLQLEPPWLTLTRIFPAAGEHVRGAVLARLQEHAEPDGCWASRSTSSLSRHDLVARLAEGIGQPLILAP